MMLLKNHLLTRMIQIYCILVLFFTTSILADSQPLSADVGYVAITTLPFGANTINPIRFAALEQAATTLGAQGGLAWEADNLNRALQREAIFLDQVFNFNQLLLDHNVLPPILGQTNNNLSVDGNTTLRIATKTYRIIDAAHFVTAPPNWRNYLWMRFKKPILADRSLLPETRAEAIVWNHYLAQGWLQGNKQGMDIFTDNLNRLKRDMTGMILYRILLAKHMVSAPFVAKAQLGVTGDSSQLRINDQILRITAQSQLQPNPAKWKPIITK